MPVGYWCPVLHAHLPYVRHPEYPQLPRGGLVLRGAERDLRAPGPGARRSPRGRRRVPAHDDALAPAHLDDEGRPPRAPLPPPPGLRSSTWPSARWSAPRREDLRFVDLARLLPSRAPGDIRRIFRETYGSNLLAAFRKHRDDGQARDHHLRRHPRLPAPHGPRAAGRAGPGPGGRRQHYREDAGRRPGRACGSPSAGTCPGTRRSCARSALRFSFLESHGLTDAQPRPTLRRPRPDPLPRGRRVLRPGHGVVAAGLERGGGLSRRLRLPGVLQGRRLGAAHGRDRATSFPTGCGKNLGIKYHRVTGKVDLDRTSSPTNRAWALEQGGRATPATSCRTAAASSQAPRALTWAAPPIVVSPYDAELFGHWWFEGPDFLNFLFRKIHFDQDLVAAHDALGVPGAAPGAARRPSPRSAPGAPRDTAKSG